MNDLILQAIRIAIALRGAKVGGRIARSRRIESVRYTFSVIRTADEGTAAAYAMLKRWALPVGLAGRNAGMRVGRASIIGWAIRID